MGDCSWEKGVEPSGTKSESASLSEVAGLLEAAALEKFKDQRALCMEVVESEGPITDKQHCRLARAAVAWILGYTTTEDSVTDSEIAGLLDKMFPPDLAEIAKKLLKDKKRGGPDGA